MQTWLLMMWSQVRAVVRRTAPLAVVVGACAGNVCVARADIQPSEPFYVTVASPDAELRCREGDISYVVATLKPGTVLIGDGKAEGWIRVQYPAGLHAVVKANEVRYDAAAKTVTLTTPSRLRAMELAGGARSHWWHLLEQNLPAGETFPVVEVLTRSEGQVEAYKIIAPTGARGFLRAEVVRDATPEEIARLGTKPLPPLTATPDAAAPSQQPGAGEPEAQAAAPGAAPAATTDEIASDPAADAAATLASPAVVPPAPVGGAEDQLMDRVDALANVFNDVQGQPLREAELEPVIAEFEQAIAAMGDGETEQVLKGFLTTRLEVLKLRQDIRVQLATIHGNTETLAEEAKRIEELVSGLTNAGRYAVVGRLTPSTVYDGRRLPLMYRIESVEPGISRTLAYLQPKAGEDFARMLGRIVGVVGQIETDADRNIKVVRYTAVDLIQETPVAPTAEAAPAPAAGAETAAVDQGSD